MSRPLLDPFGWATTAGSRENPAEGLQNAGFTEGEPVSAKILNAVMGNALDWIRHIGGISGDELVTAAAASGCWSSDADEVAYAVLGWVGRFFVPVTYGVPFDHGSVRLHSQATLNTVLAHGVLRKLSAGGSIDEVSVSISALVGAGTEYDINVALFDDVGNVGLYSLEGSTSTGSVVIPHVSGNEDFSGWTHAAVLLALQPNNNADDYVDLASVSLNLQ